MNFRLIDKVAVKCPKNQTNSISNLVKYLTFKLDEDLDKVRVFWKWITLNIKQDVSKYFTKRKKKNPYHDVLKSKLGIGEDYASLF